MGEDLRCVARCRTQAALVKQPLEYFLVAEIVVDLEVIFGMVLVVCRRFENRVEVECIHSETPQVIKVVDDALEVAAEIVVRFRFPAPGPRSGRIVR